MNQSQLRPVATDKGIEGLAEIAQAALVVDYGAAKGAIADATAALKRVIKRAEALEHQRIEIVTSRGPRLEFSGRLVCEHEFETGKSPRLSIRMSVFQTVGGALIGETSTIPSDGTAKEFIASCVVEPQDDVQAMRFAILDFFEWNQGARNMVAKAGWNLRREVA